MILRASWSCCINNHLHSWRCGRGQHWTEFRLNSTHPRIPVHPKRTVFLIPAASRSGSSAGSFRTPLSFCRRGPKAGRWKPLFDAYLLVWRFYTPDSLDELCRWALGSTPISPQTQKLLSAPSWRLRWFWSARHPSRTTYSGSASDTGWKGTSTKEYCSAKSDTLLLSKSFMYPPDLHSHEWRQLDNPHMHSSGRVKSLHICG